MLEHRRTRGPSRSVRPAVPSGSGPCGDSWPEPTLVTIIASISGVSTRPELVADPAHHALHEQRHEHDRAEHADADREAGEVGGADHAAGETARSDDGLPTRRSHDRKTAISAAPSVEHPEDLRRQPHGAAWPPRTVAKQQHGEPGGQQRRARVVDPACRAPDAGGSSASPPPRRARPGRRAARRGTPSASRRCRRSSRRVVGPSTEARRTRRRSVPASARGPTAGRGRRSWRSRAV